VEGGVQARMRGMARLSSWWFGCELWLWVWHGPLGGAASPLDNTPAMQPPLVPCASLPLLALALCLTTHHASDCLCCCCCCCCCCPRHVPP
jgi:hypothetical protein